MCRRNLYYGSTVGAKFLARREALCTEIRAFIFLRTHMTAEFLERAFFEQKCVKQHQTRPIVCFFYFYY